MRGRRADPAKLARIRAMAASGRTFAEAAAAEGVLEVSLRNYAARHGIEFVKQRTLGGFDKAAKVRDERADKAQVKVRDRRRFKRTAAPDGVPAQPLSEDHPAVVEGRTRQRKMVIDDPGDFPVLVDGANNSKIGGDVLVGRLKGAGIYTVTLEERATCPRSCFHWRSCYGNHDQYARRWRPGPEFEARLRLDIEARLRERSTILVRLHYLGDFYSLEYVHLWHRLLGDHPGLNAFGFTAWEPESPIGRAVSMVRTMYSGRFMIRHSGRTGTWGSATLDFPTERRKIGDMVVCPEQADAMNDDPRRRHCGSCALCWQSNCGIFFVEH